MWQTNRNIVKTQDASFLPSMFIFNIIKNHAAQKASDFSAEDLELVSRVRFPIGNDELEVRHCSALV